VAKRLSLTIDDLHKMKARDAIEDGWFRYTTIDFTLPSGRQFRYQMADYPFRVDATGAEIDALVCRIIRDKYRYCQWDREHPQTNQEVEIFDAIKEWILDKVAKAVQLQAEAKAGKHS
jgi:hypothetical protein